MSAQQYVKQLKSSDETFNLAQFVGSVPTPLVVIKFGASWCGPCKEIAPLYEQLASRGGQIVSCFEVDVEESESIAVAAEISKLPTFVFYTTKLSADRATLVIVDKVIGPDGAALTEKFSQGYKVVSSFLAAQAPSIAQPQNQAPIGQPQSSAPVGYQQQQQAPPSIHSAPSVPISQLQQQQQPLSTPAPSQGQAPRPNDIVKRELVAIRNNLVAAIQQVEKLYGALQ